MMINSDLVLTSNILVLIQTLPKEEEMTELLIISLSLFCIASHFFAYGNHEQNLQNRLNI